MGTRNLTIVKYNDQIKVAQYGQWDGYPKGVGQGIVDFLHKTDLNEFKEKIKACHFMPQEKLEKMTDEQYGKLLDEQPQFSRDTADKVLDMIMANKKKVFELKNSLEFGFDDLFCEWLYIIDLDKDRLYVRHNLIDPFCVKYNLDYLPDNLDALNTL